MKIDQIAFYAETPEAEEDIKAHFGLKDAEWIHDEVTASSIVRGGFPRNNRAHLQFNYDLGIELEILRYTEGDHWHLMNPSWLSRGRPFISHVGIHLEDHEGWPTDGAFLLVQETRTSSHTSHYLTKGGGAGRTYHYRIYETAPGSFIKYIRRIHP